MQKFFKNVCEMKKPFYNLKTYFCKAIMSGLVAIFMIAPTVVSVIGLAFCYVAKFFYLCIKGQKTIIKLLISKTVF